MASEYLCNLIIPGAAKSGTSSLHEALDQHPEICMSEPKEPQFFSFNDRFAGGAESHNIHFTGHGPMRYYGESSQCYFAHEHAIERIARALHCPKIIIILRDPIERLFSQYAWNYKRATEVDSLINAIKTRGETVDYTFDNRIHCYRELGGYVAFSRYSKWVPQWQKCFGAQNVLVLRFEDLVENHEHVLHRCFDFLGVEAVDSIVMRQTNTTESTRTAILPNYVTLAAKILPPVLKKRFVYDAAKWIIYKTLTPQPDTDIDENFRSYLEKELTEDIAYHRTIDRV